VNPTKGVRGPGEPQRAEAFVVPAAGAAVGLRLRSVLGAGSMTGAGSITGAAAGVLAMSASGSRDGTVRKVGMQLRLF